MSTARQPPAESLARGQSERLMSARVVMLALVLAAGIGLRFYDLGGQGLSMDEGWSWAVSRLSAPEIIGWAPHEHHPPLYYLIVKAALSILPRSEAAVRAASAAASAAALVAAAIYVRRFWGSRAALLTTVLISLSTFDLMYAREARMYALLAALWLAQALCLGAALRAGDRWIILWGLIGAVLPWVHLYGFLALGISAACAVGFWVFDRLRRTRPAIGGGGLLAALALTAAGAGPVLVRYWGYHAQGTGGLAASVPAPKDLGGYFGAIGAGVAAARSRFLDPQGLVPAPLASVPYAFWGILGLAFCALAVRGMLAAWRQGGVRRREAVLGAVSIFGPVLVVYVTANTLGQRMWAYKALLGPALLLYLWMGIGASRLGRRTGRVAVCLYAAVALTSLVPYYTVWRRADLMPPPERIPEVSQGALLCEPSDLATLVWFYAGTKREVWGVESADGARIVERLSPRTFFLGGRPPVPCAEITGPVFVCGEWRRALEAVRWWPDCLRSADVRLWVDGTWRRLQGQSQAAPLTPLESP